MRIESVLVLALVGCSAAVACGGSSEVQTAGVPEDGGEGGKGGSAGKGGKGGSAGKGGKGGSSGKGGSGGGDSGAPGTGGNGASGGDTPEAGTGGTGGDPGVGGGAGVSGAGLGGTDSSGGVGAMAGEGGTSVVAGGSAGVGGDGTAGEGGEVGVAGFGNLRVLVSRPSGGSAVEVDITGPNFSQSVDRSTLFSDLEAGEYVVTATPSVVPGTIVSAVYDPVIAGTPALVLGGGQANVSVGYPVKRNGTGQLWATDMAVGGLFAFNASRLNAPSTTPSDLQLTVSGATRVSSALAFDPEGNAWVGDCSGIGDVVKIPVAALTGSAERTAVEPSLVLEPGQSWSRCVVALDFDFDSEGALYATYNRNVILKWTPEQLSTMPDPNVPAAHFRITGFSSLQDSAFDLDGNLWVTDYGSGQVGKLSSQLQTTDEAVVPAVTWPAPEAEGLAFGPDGNLWISTYDNRIEAFDPSSTTAPTAARSITLDVTGGFQPWGIAFDESDNLWAVGQAYGHIIRINAADLTTDGTKTPAIHFTNTGMTLGGGLVFNPGR